MPATLNNHTMSTGTDINKLAVRENTPKLSERRVRPVGISLGPLVDDIPANIADYGREPKEIAEQ